MIRTRFLFLAAALVLLAISFFTGCRKNSAAAKDTLVVGMDLSYPPFETIDKDGNPTGVSVDLAHALGASLNKKIVIENIPFAGLIPSLKTGKIDLIISSMTMTPERAKSISFSDPYLTTGLAVLAKKGTSIRDIKGADQLGKTIVVRQGTTGQTYAMQNVLQATVVPLEKESSAVLEVVQGKADAFVYDQMSVWKNWQENPDTTQALLMPFQKESWAIGLRKHDAALRRQVNTFLQEFRQDGGFSRLGDKYLSEQKKAFAAQNIPFVF